MNVKDSVIIVYIQIYSFIFLKCSENASALPSLKASGLRFTFKSKYLSVRFDIIDSDTPSFSPICFIVDSRSVKK